MKVGSYMGGSRRISCTRLPSFCLKPSPNHRARFRPPSIELKPISGGSIDQPDYCNNIVGKEGATLGRRRIMVVVDSSPEVKIALQWALSQTVHGHDTLVLLHVVKQSTKKKGTYQSERTKRHSRSYELLHAMRKLCQAKKPEVHVESLVVEGKDGGGPTIVEEAKRQNISLLVLGQKKRYSITLMRLMWMHKIWAGNRPMIHIGSGVVEYCIQNATCMTLAVRKKNRRSGGGGYLVTTKRHKEFWLLA